MALGVTEMSAISSAKREKEKKKHPTTNIQQPTTNGVRFGRAPRLDVRCWMLVVECSLILRLRQFHVLGQVQAGFVKLAEQLGDELGRRHAVEARLIIENQP